MSLINWSVSFSLFSWSNIYLVAFGFFVLGLIIGWYIRSMKRSQEAELQNQLEVSRQKQVNLEDEVIYLETKMDKFKNQIGDLEDELSNAKKNIKHLKG